MMWLALKQVEERSIIELIEWRQLVGWRRWGMRVSKVVCFAKEQYRASVPLPDLIKW